MQRAVLLRMAQSQEASGIIVENVAFLFLRKMLHQLAEENPDGMRGTALKSSQSASYLRNHVRHPA